MACRRGPLASGAGSSGAPGGLVRRTRSVVLRCGREPRRVEAHGGPPTPYPSRTPVVRGGQEGSPAPRGGQQRTPHADDARRRADDRSADNTAASVQWGSGAETPHRTNGSRTCWKEFSWCALCREGLTVVRCAALFVLAPSPVGRSCRQPRQGFCGDVSDRPDTLDRPPFRHLRNAERPAATQRPLSSPRKQ
jgi:hypothetical protein